MTTTREEDLSEELRAARIALSEDRLQDAETLLRSRLAREPSDVDALHGLAVVARRAGRLPDAIVALERALEARPDDVGAWNNLGGFRRETGDLPGAAVAFERALALDPGHASTLFNLASLEYSRANHARTVELVERLVKVTPDDAVAWNLLGLALCDTDRVDEALAALERALALAPAAADVHNNLGVVLGFAGRGVEARAAFESALRLDPRFPRAWENLVRSMRVRDGDKGMVGLMQQALAASPVDSIDAACLEFALGKAHDDLGLYDDAFAHYQRGNAFVARFFDYRPRVHDDFVDALIATFDESFVTRARASADSVQGPIFVVGMPRSGTTLVEQVLAAHPLVSAGGELGVVPRALAALEVATGEAFPQAARRATAPELAAFATSVAAGLLERARGAPWVTDKLPGNYLHLGMIHALLPGARVVHCRRDPRDTCLSIYFQRFAYGHEFGYSLQAIGRRYRAYQRLMAHWRELMGTRLLEVEYEALAADPAGEAARLYAALGLDFEPGYLRQLGRGGAVRTASSWQVRRPVDTGSVARWKHYAAHLGELEAGLEGHR